MGDAGSRAPALLPNPGPGWLSLTTSHSAHWAPLGGPTSPWPCVCCVPSPSTSPRVHLALRSPAHHIPWPVWEDHRGPAPSSSPFTLPIRKTSQSSLSSHRSSPSHLDLASTLSHRVHACLFMCSHAYTCVSLCACICICVCAHFPQWWVRAESAKSGLWTSPSQVPRPAVSAEEGSPLRSRVMDILLRNGKRELMSSWTKVVWGSKRTRGSGRRPWGGSPVTSECCRMSRQGP